MRLRVYIVGELLVAATAITAVGGAGWLGLGFANDYLGAHSAVAATANDNTSVPAIRAPVEIMPTPAISIAKSKLSEPINNVFGAPDEELLAPLRNGSLTRVKFNHGGTSLSLRLDFDTGGRGAFKPEQTWPQSDPRRELAAYRIDRLLGIGHVPPVVARTFRVDDLINAMDEHVQSFGAKRFATEGLPRGDSFVGEVSWWIPEIMEARIGNNIIESNDGVLAWKHDLRVGATIPEQDYELVRQISDMTLFDFIIDNIDRWTGGNADIAPGGTVLFFMDNTLSFTKLTEGHNRSQLYLQRVQTFSRRLVTRLRTFTEAELRADLDRDRGPFEHVLTEDEIIGVLGRRDAALRYIDKLIAKHGEDAVLRFP